LCSVPHFSLLDRINRMNRIKIHPDNPVDPV